MKIYLIGMPGSGKSTLGKPLADYFNLPFIDLDEEIERREQKTIPDIFSEFGEDYFRLVESALLREHAGSTQSFVLATGGGTPCFFDGIRIMNETGLTIFLDVPLNTILERVKHSKNRPLLQENKEREDKLRKLLAIRGPIYSTAKIRAERPDLQSVINAIEHTQK